MDDQKELRDEALDENVARLLREGSRWPRLSSERRSTMLDALKERQAAVYAAPRERARRGLRAPIRIGRPLVAVAALLMLGLTTWVFREVRSSLSVKQMAQVSQRGLPGAPLGVEPAAATMGLVEALTRKTLEDGTVLICRRGAEFRVEGRRTIRVSTGDLYLIVARAEQPFVVRTAHGVAQATGTRFVVSVGSGTTVAVSQGKVRLSNEAGEVEVRRGEQGRLEAEERPTRHPAPRLSFLVNWAREALSQRELLVTREKHDTGELMAIDPWGQSTRLTLRKYHVDVHIEDGIARTTVDQTFFNHMPGNTEGTFYFPLPPDASVSRLAMYVNGQLMEGGMVERSRGQQIYTQILYQRRDPALLEMMEGNVFKLRIFPIEGRQEKRIFLSYTQKLEELYGTVRYWFPMDHTHSVARELSLRVRVKDGAGRLSPQSSTHRLEAKEEGDDLVLDYRAKEVRPDQDLLLHLVPSAGEEEPSLATLKKNGFHYVFARVTPTLTGRVAPRPRQWVILNDVSASRTKIDLQAQAYIVRRLLAEADDADTVALINLSTRARVQGPPFVPTRGSAAAKLPGLARVKLPLGGTNLAAGLEAAAKLCGAHEVETPHLLYLGDGVATDGPRVVDELLQRLPEGSVFVGVGVGKKADARFLQAAADQTGGMFTYINPDEDIDWRVFDLVAALNTPRLAELEIEFRGENAESAEIVAYPSARALADGESLFVVGRTKDKLPAALVVQGRMGSETYERSFSLEGAKAEAEFIPRFWAKRHIDELLKYGEEHKDEIVRLSKQYYVVTPYTSLIVLENEAMYEEFNVERGRKDHWALYPAPKAIKVVREPIDWGRWSWWGYVPLEDGKAKAKTKPKSIQEIVDSVQFRINAPFYYWPPRRYEYGRFALYDMLDAEVDPTRAVTDLFRMAAGCHTARDGEEPRADGVLTVDRKVSEESMVAGRFARYCRMPAPALDPMTLAAPQGYLGRLPDVSLLLRDNVTPIIYPDNWRPIRDRGQYHLGELPVSFGPESSGLPAAGIAFDLGLSLATQPYPGPSRDGASARPPHPAVPFIPDFDGCEPTKPPPRLGPLLRRPDFGHMGMGMGLGKALPAEVFVSYVNALQARAARINRHIGRCNAQYSGYGHGGWETGWRSGGLPGPVPASRPLPSHAQLTRLVPGAAAAFAADVLATRRDELARKELSAEEEGELLALRSVFSKLDLAYSRLESTEPFWMFHERGYRPQAWTYPEPRVQTRHYHRWSYDLTRYAPGLYSTSLDVLDLVAEEYGLAPVGKIDMDAVKRIQEARRAIRPVRIRWPSARTELVVGASDRIACVRKTEMYLEERVVCDGEYIYHLYPELGLAARRPATELRRAALRQAVPFFVEPADWLARQYDVELIDSTEGSFVLKLLPRAPAREGDRAPDTARHLLVEVSGDGRILRKTWLAGETVLVRLSYEYDDEKILVRTFSADDSELGRLALRVEPVEREQDAFRVDLERYVVFDLPLRKPSYYLQHQTTLEAEKGSVLARVRVKRHLVLALLQELPGQRPSRLTSTARTRTQESGILLNEAGVPPKLGDLTLLGSCHLGGLIAEWRVKTDVEASHPIVSYYPRTGDQSKAAAIRDAHPDTLVGHLSAYQAAIASRRRTEHFDILLRDWRNSPLLPAAADCCSENGKDRDVWLGLLDHPRWSWLAVLMAGKRYHHEAAEAPRDPAKFVRVLETGRTPQDPDKKRITEAIIRVYEDLSQRGLEAPIPPYVAELLRDVEDGKYWKAVLQRAWKVAVGSRRVGPLLRFAELALTNGEHGFAGTALALAKGRMSGAPPVLADLAIAQAYWAGGRPEEALDLASKVLAALRAKGVPPSPALLAAAAQMARQAGNADRAIELEERALTMEHQFLPDPVNIEFYRGRYRMLAYHHRSKIAQAVEASDEATIRDCVARAERMWRLWYDVDKDYPWMVQHMATLQRICGRGDRAWHYLSSLIDRRPRDAMSYDCVARWYREHGERDDAQRWYVRAYECDTANPQWLFQRAQLLKQLGRIDEAHKLYDEIIGGEWAPGLQWWVQKARKAMGR